jgi:hypothetical protein
MENLKSSTAQDYSRLQNFVLLWMLHSLFWVIPRRLNFLCRRFGTLVYSIFIGCLNKNSNNIRFIDHSCYKCLHLSLLPWEVYFIELGRIISWRNFKFDSCLTNQGCSCMPVKLSQRSSWWYGSSVAWLCVVGWMAPDVSKDQKTFILKGESKKRLLDSWHSDTSRETFIFNTDGESNLFQRFLGTDLFFRPLTVVGLQF